MSEVEVPFIAKQVYFGHYSDDGLIVDDDEKTKRSVKLADGRFLNETTLRTAVPIDDGALRDIPVGDFTGKPEVMWRCWAESDPKRGARITRSQWGGIDTKEWSWAGPVIFADEDELEWEPEERIMILRFRIRGRATGTSEVNILKKDDTGAVLATLETLSWTEPRGATDLIGAVIKEEQAVAFEWIEPGGARNVVLHMDYVRIG